jgi:hypothetical protein
MDLQKIKNSLDCYVSGIIETAQKTKIVETAQETKQYKKCIEYQFELILCSLVAAGTLTEMALYSVAKSPWWGLLWLLPIYGMYKRQLKFMAAQQKINTYPPIN